MHPHYTGTHPRSGLRARGRRAALLVCLVASLAAGMALGRPALAQQPATAPECAAGADTVPGDSVQVRRDLHGRLALALFTFAVAPSLLLPHVDPCLYADEPELGFWRDHATVSVALRGVADTLRMAGGLGAELELLHRGLYAELRLEQYYASADLPRPVRLWSARAGYLIHPARHLAGGVTVGYRHARGAPGEWPTTGVEISFPLIGVLCRNGGTCWMRWEPAYVFTPVRVTMSPRFEAEFPVRRTPFIAGFTLEAKGVREPDPWSAAVRLGMRF